MKKNLNNAQLQKDHFGKKKDFGQYSARHFGSQAKNFEILSKGKYCYM